MILAVIAGAAVSALAGWAILRRTRRSATTQRVQRLQVAWAEVPFEDQPGRSKRRPVVLVDGGYLKCTSQDKSDRPYWYHPLSPDSVAEFSRNAKQSWVDTSRIRPMSELTHVPREDAYLTREDSAAILQRITEGRRRA
jgi:hypothetical protein